MHKFFIVFYLFLLSQSTEAQNDTILIDFGNTPSTAPWNNIGNQFNGQISPLVNHYGFTTNYSIEVYDDFNGINGDGTQQPDPVLGIPPTASGDSFFGNMQSFSGQIQPTGGIRFTGLLPDKPYTIQLFSSRIANDNRETMYTISGQTVDSLFLNVASNINTQVQLTLYPAIDSTIDVQATAGLNNTNTYGFFYLGVAKLIYAHEPLSNPVSLDLVTPDGGEYWQVGKTASIQWQSENVGLLSLEYSYDNGTNWAVIDSVFASQQSYDWVIPNTPSTQCLVRVSADTLSDISSGTFEITTDTSSCSIVVLGSSTAAGTGPSVPDSTWVNRYRNAIAVADTRIEVINLALGGYTTYHILPTGTAISTGINIDTSRNITKALSFDPSAIIINMPSNDAANNFSVAQQMANFDLLFTTAQLQDIDTWICTTQPRNGFSQAQVQIQEEVKDSILTIYGSQSIDFWNGFATSNGFLVPTYDSGDGVHMNDQGHRILFELVQAKQIEQAVCGSPVLETDEVIYEPQSIKVYPNPGNDYINVEVESANASLITIDFFDVLGRLAYQAEGHVAVGKKVIQFQLPGDLVGLFYLRIKVGNRLHSVPFLVEKAH